MLPSISIVIPTLNSGGVLEKCLKSSKFLFTAGWRFLGHMMDFSPKQLGQHGENN